jgi:hypothetical protein
MLSAVKLFYPEGRVAHSNVPSDTNTRCMEHEFVGEDMGKTKRNNKQSVPN